jgi:hypothetical protein
MEDPAGPARPTGIEGFANGVPAACFLSDEGFALTVVFDRSGDVREVRFSGSNLRVGALHRVRIGALADEARERIQVWVLANAAARQSEARAAGRRAPKKWPLADLEAGFQPPSHVGGPRKTDLELALAARDYVEQCVEKGAKVGTVARRRGQRASTFSDWLQMARQRDLLAGNPPRGQVDGELTARAKQLLEEAQQMTEEVR